MGDPSNRNQSHLLQGRSTSRISAPPGGHSSFSIGGYVGSSDSSQNRRGSRDSAPSQSDAPNRRSPATRATEVDHPKPNASRHASKTIPSKSSGERQGIPGLESHYSAGSSEETNTYASNYDNDIVNDSDYRSSNHQETREQQFPLAQKKKIGTGPASGAEYAAQLRAQMAVKKQMSEDSDDTYHRQGGSRYEGGSDTGSNTRRASDSRQDNAMHEYSDRQESDREKDYRRMQDMVGTGAGAGGYQRSEQRNSNHKYDGGNSHSDRDYDERVTGASYKATSANASNSAPVHTSTRVHAPPGGHSSFQIGWG